MVIVAVKKIMKYILGRFSQRKHYHMDLFLVKIYVIFHSLYLLLELIKQRSSIYHITRPLDLQTLLKRSLVGH